jgi:hypothetical protein
MPINAAYVEAQRREKDAKRGKDEIAEPDKTHPDLASAVREERMTLAEADEAIELTKNVDILRKEFADLADQVEEGKLVRVRSLRMRRPTIRRGAMSPHHTQASASPSL